VLDIVNGRYTPGAVYWWKGLGKDRLGERQLLLQEDDKKYTMSTANTADLDGDKLIDLVIGDTSGAVYWSRNIGSKTEPRFGPRVPLLVGDKGVKVSHKSDPYAVDFDGDGKLDLLVGDETADVAFFRGTGRAKFAPGVSLFSGLVIDPKDGYTQAKKKLDPHRVLPGYRLRVTAVDWNLDGKLDLLIGNCEEGQATAGADGKAQRGATTGRVWVLLRK
jgi:hypothetical protein